METSSPFPREPLLKVAFREVVDVARPLRVGRHLDQLSRQAVASAILQASEREVGEEDVLARLAEAK